MSGLEWPPRCWSHFEVGLHGVGHCEIDLDHIGPHGLRTPPPAAPDPANLARWLQDWAESQPAITIRSGVEPQVAWRALADELLRRWGR